MISNVPVAVIDVGSNSVRLMTVFNFNKKTVALTTRLGENFKDGKLDRLSIERTVEAIKNLYVKAVKEGAIKVYAFATAAVRNAENKNEFLDAVYNSVGLKIDVLSGDEEAETGLIGALKGKPGGIIDVGGASSEVIYGDGKNILYKKSLNLGAVSLFNEFKADRLSVKNYLTERVKEYGKTVKGSYRLIGGSATCLASIKLKLKVYDASKTDGTDISKKELEEIAEYLKYTDFNEVSKIYPISQKRAETLYFGAEIINVITSYLKIGEAVISESGNLEGYLIKKGEFDEI